MTNMNQLMNNTREYVQTIIDTELINEPEEVKAKFMKKMMRHNISTHIDTNLVDKTLMESKAEVKAEQELNKLNQGSEE